LLPRGKAPRGDGLPTEFFQKPIQLTTPNLFETFKSILEKNILEVGEMPPNLNNEEIILILKNDDHSRLAIGAPSCYLVVCTRFLLRFWCVNANLTSLKSLSPIKQDSWKGGTLLTTTTSHMMPLLGRKKTTKILFPIFRF
jgi:hypothetical protein